MNTTTTEGCVPDEIYNDDMCLECALISQSPVSARTPVLTECWAFMHVLNSLLQKFNTLMVSFF